MNDETQLVLKSAKRRLDIFNWYPNPVDIRKVKIIHAPRFFRLPGMRRYIGYEIGNLILLKKPIGQSSYALIVHELTHVWQNQHRPLWLWISFLFQGYWNNIHEREARMAAGQEKIVPLKRRIKSKSECLERKALCR